MVDFDDLLSSSTIEHFETPSHPRWLCGMILSNLSTFGAYETSHAGVRRDRRGQWRRRADGCVARTEPGSQRPGRQQGNGRTDRRHHHDRRRRIDRRADAASPRTAGRRLGPRGRLSAGHTEGWTVSRRPVAGAIHGHRHRRGDRASLCAEDADQDHDPRPRPHLRPRRAHCRA